jgi:hypothetical protein
MTSEAIMGWTEEDEVVLQRMLQRKQDDLNGKRDCVLRRVVWSNLEGSNAGEITNLLIEHATAFRKLLEPFDKEAKHD